MSDFNAVNFALSELAKEVSLPSETTIGVGGIQAGTIIKKKTNEQIFTQMLIKNVAPKTSLTFLDSSGAIIDTNIIRENGITLNIKTINAISNKNTDMSDIAKMTTYSDPVSVAFAKTLPEGANPINVNTNTFTFNNIAINSTTTFSVEAIDKEGDIGKTSQTLTFVNACYTGLADVSETIDTMTETDILNGKHIIQKQGDINEKFVGTGKIFFAYDSSYGVAKQIMDVANGMNILNAFKSKELTMTKANGTTVKYLVYLANIKGVYNGNEATLKLL